MIIKMVTRKFKHMTLQFVGFNYVQIITFFIACSFVFPSYAQTETAAESESQLKELLTTVYCYCGCERETIEACVCGTAGLIEEDFRNRLLAGQTVEQIRTNYLDTYGPQFYAVMPAEGINLIAYIMPIVILALIGGVAFAVLRKSRQQLATTTGGGGMSKQQVTDTTLKQVEAELERYKQQK